MAWNILYGDPGRKEMFRVIETFSGIGSQAKALTRIGKPFEIVNTADWDINAILAYCLIHKGKIDINKYADISDEDVTNFLKGLSLSSDGKKPMSDEAFRRMPMHLKRRLYAAIKETRNMVSITDVMGSDIPDNIDLFTYSFPCQDLSLCGCWHGNKSGIARDAHNRSGMLWEVERILLEMNEMGKELPRLEQSDEYKPFALLNDDSMDEVFNFDEKDIGNVLGFLFKINLNSKKLFIYQQAYVGSRLQAKNNLRIIQKDNVFEIVDKEMLKIDKRGELLILDNTILVRNVKVLQDFFGFQVFVRNQAQSVISKLEELDIIGNIATLKEYQTGEKLTISKKLMKVKNSPVLAMDKDELINKIPLVPRYKNIIHIENGKIRTNTKKDVDNLMKLLNDDYVKSELTDMEYDSTSKTLLNSESQDE